MPWHWDRDVRIAVAPGVTCFEASKVYEHGGVSPQECVVPRLVVSRRHDAAGDRGTRRSRELKWLGLTLVVEFDEPARRRHDRPPHRAPATRRRASPTSAKETGGTGKVLAARRRRGARGRAVPISSSSATTDSSCISAR